MQTPRAACRVFFLFHPFTPSPPHLHPLTIFAVTIPPPRPTLSGDGRLMPTSIRLEALERRCLLALIAPNPAFGNDGVVTLSNDGGNLYNSSGTLVKLAGGKILAIGDDFTLVM